MIGDKRIALACFVMMGLSVVSTHGQIQGFQSTDLHDLKSVGDVQISPDGSTILFTVTNREGSGGSSSRLWIYDIESESMGQLLESSGSTARWSPDGSHIAYMGDLNDRSGLVVIRADGSGARFLAEVTGTNQVFDPLGGSWDLATPIPTARSHSAIAVVDTLIYLIGGRYGPLSQAINLAVNEAYSPASGLWLLNPEP